MLRSAIFSDVPLGKPPPTLAPAPAPVSVPAPAPLPFSSPPRPRFDKCRARLKLILSRIPIHRLLLYLLAVAAVYWFLTRMLPVLYNPSVQDRLTMRPSVLVREKDMPRFTQQLKPRMRLYMDKFPGLKVVCAPYLRHYVMYMIMNVNGNVVGMFNPSFEVLKNSTSFGSQEKSLICEDQTHYSLMHFTRHRSIIVHYTGEDMVAESVVLRDLDAAGFQHVMDLFQGQWLCPDEGRQKNIPAGENHIFDPAVAAELYRSSRHSAEL